MNLFTKQKQTHGLREGTTALPGRKGGEEGQIGEFGIDMYTLLYLKQIF